MLTAVSLMGVGYLLLSQAGSYVTFLIVYTGLISLAHAGGFMHAPMTLTNTWFIRLRARAMTINSAAYGLGGVLLAPMLGMIVHSWGWRWGAAIAGMAFLLIGIPLCLTIRNSPESMGLLPDGEPTLPSASGDKQSRRPAVAETEVTASQAIRSFAFWALVFGAAVRNAAYHAISTHFIPLMVWKGMSQQEATLMLSAFAFLGFASTLIFGWLADSMNKPRLVSIDSLHRGSFHLLSYIRRVRFCLWVFLFCSSQRWKPLTPWLGRWSAISSAANTSPRFAVT